MKFLNISLTPLQFNFIFSIFISILNFNFFKYLLDNSLFMFVLMIILLPIALNIIFSILLPSILIFRFLLCGFITIISSLCAYFIAFYGIKINDEIVLSTLNTDLHEVFGYFSVHFAIWIIVSIILPLFLVLKVKNKPYKNIYKNIFYRFLVVFCGTFIIAIMLISTGKHSIPFFREHSEIRRLLLPSYPIYSTFKLYQKMSLQNKEFTKIGLDAKLKNTGKKLFVLIVGETARAANYSLNNYKINDTNFYTKNINGLVSMSNFYSCGTYTALSVPCMFSPLTRKEFDALGAKYSENLLDILNRVGIESYWYDNNSGGCIGVCDRIEKNTKLFKASGYDDKIFNLANEKIDQIAKNPKSTIIILHLQGSHGPTYFERYPENFAKFNPTCQTAQLSDCDSAKIFNAYDNTLLYTDYLMSKILKQLNNIKNKFDLVGLWYMSDHGESLGENGIYLHGLPYSIAPEFQRHIPSLIWTSNTDLNSHLKSIKDNVLSHDNVFSSVLGFFDVKTKIKDDKLDIFRYNQGE